jgi:hypothetical protein
MRKMKMLMAATTAVLIAMAACKSAPTTPTPPWLDISGNWSGIISYDQDPVHMTYTWTTSFIQSGDTVTGTWSSSSGLEGSVSWTIYNGSSIRGTLSGSGGYLAYIGGIISDPTPLWSRPTRITGSGTDNTSGAFGFNLIR